MATFRTRLARSVAALVLVGAGIPALGQKNPESILPPGFGDQPAPAPAPSPRAPASPTAPGAAPSPAPLVPPSLSLDLGEVNPTPTPTPTPTLDPAELRRALADYELPPFARRSLAVIGPATSRDGGLAEDAFGLEHGPYLERLMHAQDGQIASRWLAIALRRALMSRLDTPDGVNGADFAAERAWLLLRMGEATAARAVVQGVDPDRYTAKLYQVAMQVALATADPAALCPLVDGALKLSDEAGWVMARAMCAGLAGNATQASALLKAAQGHRVADGIDLLLPEKVLGAGPDGRQAVTIEWDPVVQLTAWRFGLATATGVKVPDPLYATVGPQMNGWRALAPGIALADRVAPAEAAAASGVLSNAALVDLYGAVAAADDAPALASATASDLATAYAGASPDQRVAALRRLWGTGTKLPYARLVLTARAAARIAPVQDSADADPIVAAMLSAGLDRSAQRWAGQVTQGGDAWAMLLLADPDSQSRVPYRSLSHYSGSGNAALKQRMLFAGLAGLGRLGADDTERAAKALDVPIGLENAWTQALDAAVEANQPGTVVLLSAMGMQTPDWRGVPPAALFRIVDALRRVGLGGEARMIAAEAIARA